MVDIYFKKCQEGGGGGEARFCFIDKSIQNGCYFSPFKDEGSEIRIHTILNNGVGIQIQSMCLLRFYCFLYFLRDKLFQKQIKTLSTVLILETIKFQQSFRKVKSSITAVFCLYAIFVVVKQNLQVPYYMDNHFFIFFLPKQYFYIQFFMNPYADYSSSFS